jgi:MarR family transcriptional regulator, organic hydroperoxide resistance regulator
MEAAPLTRLREEIQQTRPFQDMPHAASLAVLRTAEYLRRRNVALLAGHVDSPEQYNVLRILRGAGSDGLPTLEIAARLLEASPGITRMLDKMEAKGLVRRERCREDRRQVLCYLTPAGLAVVNVLDEPVRRSTRECFQGLGNEELLELIELLDRIRHPRKGKQK